MSVHDHDPAEDSVPEPGTPESTLTPSEEFAVETSSPPEPDSPPMETASVEEEQAEEQMLEREEEEYLVLEQQEYEAEYGAEPTPAEPTTPTEPAAPPSHDPTTGPQAPAEPTHGSGAPEDMTFNQAGDPVHGVAPTDHVIGDPSQDASQWTFQVANGYCGPNSISMMFEASTGIHLSEQQVARFAIDNHEMTRLPKADDPSGEPSLHYGMLPEQAVATINELGKEHGVSAKLESGSISDLETSLRGGHEIMVEVDADRLWHDDPSDAGQADHFVVVTGIDPSTGTVFLNDPGDPDGKEESIPLSEFESAWKTSDNAMIVTHSDHPAPDSTGGALDGGADAKPDPIMLPVVLRTGRSG